MQRFDTAKLDEKPKDPRQVSPQMAPQYEKAIQYFLSPRNIDAMAKSLDIYDQRSLKQSMRTWISSLRLPGIGFSNDNYSYNALNTEAASSCSEVVIVNKLNNQYWGTRKGLSAKVSTERDAFATLTEGVCLNDNMPYSSVTAIGTNSLRKVKQDNGDVFLVKEDRTSAAGLLNAISKDGSSSGTSIRDDNQGMSGYTNNWMSNLPYDFLDGGCEGNVGNSRGPCESMRSSGNKCGLSEIHKVAPALAHRVPSTNNDLVRASDGDVDRFARRSYDPFNQIIGQDLAQYYNNYECGEIGPGGDGDNEVGRRESFSGGEKRFGARPAIPIMRHSDINVDKDGHDYRENVKLWKYPYSPFDLSTPNGVARMVGQRNKSYNKGGGPIPWYERGLYARHNDKDLSDTMIHYELDSRHVGFPKSETFQGPEGQFMRGGVQNKVEWSHIKQ